MVDKIDIDIKNISYKIFDQPFVLHNIDGGLFNIVVQVRLEQENKYIKKFTDKAQSGYYPPLPTTAYQRFIVAKTWHYMSIEASKLHNTVTIPAITSCYDDFFIIVMDEFKGMPLYDVLLNNKNIDIKLLEKVVVWLASLHNSKIIDEDILYSASNDFKKFKIQLQYNNMLKYLPSDLITKAEHFISDYLNKNDDPLHGDINSRNILIMQDEVSIIDFEQGQFGDGIYDLAYIVSEYIIHGICLNLDTEEIISKIWYLYCNTRNSVNLNNKYAAFRTHLGFQTLYRLKGPSKEVWSGHISKDIRDKIFYWSSAQIYSWLK